MTSNARPVIALIAAPETSPSVLYGLYDVLLSVGAVYPDMTIGEPGDALLDVRIVSAGGEPFRCFGDILVEPHASMADLDAVDVAIVCDMYTPIDTLPHDRYPREIAWLRRMHDARGADRVGLHGFADAGGSGSPGWAAGGLPLGLLRPLPGALPADRGDRGLDPQPVERGGRHHHGRRRHGVAGPRAARHRPSVRIGARHPDLKGLPAGRPRRWPAPVLGDDPAEADP